MARNLRIEYPRAVYQPLDDDLFDLTPPPGYQRELNPLERIAARIEAALAADGEEPGGLLHVKEALTLWHEGDKEEALSLLLGDPQPEPGPVRLLESLTLRESDLPMLEPSHLTELGEQFGTVASAAKELGREIRSRVREAEEAGETAQAALLKKRHKALGRELMRPDYVSILNLVGLSFYNNYQFD
ncbi:MAG: hypothetical protein O2960_13250 [Verrucomicrobia bacterium]|nr:hypothetical protein [Verrucomicrobiota bacterium]